ncbi:MAG: hypothetical protein IKD72_04775 [Clostridia bacterium]|nr:hypothetical protein [Clostridia bacterium]
MKNATEKTGLGGLWIVFIAAVIAALPLRVLQYLNVIEKGTGFYTGLHWSIFALFGVLTAAVALCVILGLTRRSKVGYLKDGGRQIAAGLLALPAAAAVLYDALLCVNANFSLGLPFSLPGQGELTAAAARVILLEGVFGVLSALFLLLMGVSMLSGRKLGGTFYRLLTLTPVLWSIFRMIFRFTRTISYIRVSDLLLEMLMLIFQILFFMALAQCEAQVGDKKIPWKLAGYGLPAALFGLLCFLPRAIMIAIGRADVIYAYSTLEYCDLALALFALAVAASRLIPEAQDKPTVIPVAPETDEAAKD